MGARRTARERVLQALYQLDMSGGSPEEALAAAFESGGEADLKPEAVAGPKKDAEEPQARAFAEQLLSGVLENLEEIDGLIETHSHNWRIERMARIDRNILRLGIYELQHRDDIPRKVTLNEAVELGKAFGAEGSSSFINGLLDRVAVALGKK
jgi:transcription antitermination protein NusB